MIRTVARVVFLLTLLFGTSAASAASRRLGAQTVAPKVADDDLINADRPGIADGSRVLRAGQQQLEIGFQHERRADGPTRTQTSFVPSLVRLGVTEQFEARVESNSFTYERTIAADGSAMRTSGVAPVLLGFKWGFFDSGGDGRRSIGTIVRVAPPSGSSDFRTTHVTGDIRLAGDWDFAPMLSLNPNIGVARLEGSDGETFGAALGALTLTYQPTSRLSPFIDLGYQSVESHGGTWSLVLDGGVAYIVGSDVQLDLSAGRGVHGSTPPRPFIAVGISARANAFRRNSGIANPSSVKRSPF